MSLYTVLLGGRAWGGSLLCFPSITNPKQGPDKPCLSLVGAFFWDGGGIEGGILEAYDGRPCRSGAFWPASINQAPLLCFWHLFTVLVEFQAPWFGTAYTYNKLKKTGTWMQDDLRWCPSCFWFGWKTVMFQLSASTKKMGRFGQLAIPSISTTKYIYIYT